MTDTVIGVSTRARNYDQSEGRSTTNDTPSNSQPDRSLTLAKPAFESPSRPSNATVRQTMHNFNTHVA